MNIGRRALTNKTCLFVCNHGDEIVGIEAHRCGWNVIKRLANKKFNFRRKGQEVTISVFHIEKPEVAKQAIDTCVAKYNIKDRKIYHDDIVGLILGDK